MRDRRKTPVAAFLAILLVVPTVVLLGTPSARSESSGPGGSLQKWTQYAGAVEHGGKIYIFTARENVFTGHIQRYDPVTQVTTVMGTQLPNGWFPIAGSNGQHIYIFGLDSSSAYDRRVFRYDPDADTLTQMGSMLPWNNGVLNHQAVGVVWNGQYFFLFSRGEVLRYDPATDQFTAMAGGQRYMHGSSAVLHGTHVYVFGAYTIYTGEQATIVDRYDIATNTWTQMSGSLPFYGGYWLQAGWTGSYFTVYLYGERAFYKYDHVADAWSPLSALMPSARYTSSFAVVNNKAYVLGGSDASNNFLTEVVEFDPSGTSPPGSAPPTDVRAVARDGAVEVSWKHTPTSTDESVEQFLVEKLVGGTYVTLATVPKTTRTFIDTGLTNGVSQTYRVRSDGKYFVGSPSPSVSATPDARANGTSFLFPRTSVGASNGWYNQAVPLDFIANGSTYSGAYQGIQSIRVLRFGAQQGVAKYLDEMESTAGWQVVATDPLAVPTLAQETATVKQAVASLNASLLNNPATSSDSAPKIRKPVALDLAAYDKLDVWVHYETDALLGGTGRIDVRLLDGTRVVLSATSLTLVEGWNHFTLGLTTTPRTITTLEFVLHEARKSAVPPSSERQWFTIDAVKAYSTSGLTESTDGYNLWGLELTDNLGFTHKTVQALVRVDTVPGTTTATLTGTEGNNGWYKSPVSARLTAVDTGSGPHRIDYQLNGGPTTQYAQPVQISGQGNRCISYWSTDLAGNVEPTKQSCVSIDTVAPTTTISLAGTGDGTWYSGTVGVVLTPQDPTSGVAQTWYRIDGGAWQSGTGQVADVTTVGTHVVESYSVDQAGNVETTRSRQFTIENTPPVITDRTPTPGATVGADQQIMVTHEDGGSGIDPARTVFILEQSFAGASGPWTNVTGQGTVTRSEGETIWRSQTMGGLQPATYRVRGWVEDRAGNRATLEGAGWTFVVQLM